MNFFQEWVSVDEEIHQLNEKIKQLRGRRSELDAKITAYSEEKGAKTFKLGNIAIKVATTNVAESLTFKYLEKCLSDMIKNESQIKQMMDYIKRNRSTKIVSHVERN